MLELRVRSWEDGWHQSASSRAWPHLPWAHPHFPHGPWATFQPPGCPAPLCTLCTGGRGWSSLQTKKSPFCFLWTAKPQRKLYPRWPGDFLDPCHSKWSLCSGSSTAAVWEKWKCWLSGPTCPPWTMGSESAFSQECSRFPRAWARMLYASSSPARAHACILGGVESWYWVLQYHMPGQSLLLCKLLLAFWLSHSAKVFLHFAFFFSRCHSKFCHWPGMFVESPFHTVWCQVYTSPGFLLFITEPPIDLPAIFRYDSMLLGHAVIEKIPTLPHSKLAGSFTFPWSIRTHANSHSDCTYSSPVDGEQMAAYQQAERNARIHPLMLAFVSSVSLAPFCLAARVMPVPQQPCLPPPPCDRINILYLCDYLHSISGSYCQNPDI